MLFFIFNRNLILTLLAIAVVAIIVFAVIYRKKKAANGVLEDLKDSPKKDMLIGLRDNAEAFSELYEPLYILAKGNTGRKEWVFDSWINTVNALEGQDAFKAVFAKKFGSLASKEETKKRSARKAKKIDKKKAKKCKKAAKKLLSFLKKAGILRDGTKTVTADETTAEKYDVIGTASLETDAKYDVFAPYWTLTTKTKEIIAPAEETSEAPAENVPAENVPAEDVSAEDAPVTEEAPVSEEAPAAPAKLKGKEKKKAKKQAKKDKKAAKKNKKKAKKDKKKEQFNIIVVTILLTKGAIR